MEKVSIIVPVYNMEPFVAQGLSCLTGQTYENLEIIVVDDGSTDKSFSAAKKMQEADGRIKLFRQENSGPGPARNFGLAHATGAYVYFADVDDTLVPSAIEIMVNAMERETADLVVCGFELFDGEQVTKIVYKADGVRLSGQSARKSYLPHCLTNEPLGIQGGACFKLFRRNVINCNQIEFPALRRSEDDVFVARYATHMESVYFIKDVLCRFFINNSKRFRDKYPFDVFETAREATMLLMGLLYRGFNPQNLEVRNKLLCDYYQRTFLSLWFLFSPKLKQSSFKRYRRMKQIADTFAADIPDEDFGVHYAVLTYIRNRQHLKLYVRMLYYTIKHWND